MSAASNAAASKACQQLVFYQIADRRLSCLEESCNRGATEEEQQYNSSEKKKRWNSAVENVASSIFFIIKASTQNIIWSSLPASLI